MTVLSACQTAGLRLTGVKPQTVFSTTDRFALELSDLATESALGIAKAHAWQRLTKKATLAGDGTSTAFSLPADYDRMVTNGAIYSTRSFMPMRPIASLNEWLDLEISPAVGYPGFWIIIGGELNIKPAMATGESAEFYYVSNEIVLNDTTGKTGFSADDDTFVLSERLLTLAIIWCWRAQKRLEYAEDMQNYQIAFSEDAGRDSGSQVIRVGAGRMLGNYDIAYPGTVVP